MKGVVCDMTLYKGVFWIKDIDSAEVSSVCLKALCDIQGDFTDVSSINIGALSKSKENFNHQKAWQTLDRSVTENKPYNYYPRGRVEIRNSNAVIYANPTIATEELKEWAVSAFNLTEENGIKKVILKADGSNHYKSCVER